MRVGGIVRRVILYITVVILAAQSAPTLSYAADTSGTDHLSYCQQNDVLYFNCTPCHQTVPPAADNSAGAPGNNGSGQDNDGGGCGTKGQKNAKDNIDQAWNFMVNKFMSIGFTQDQAQIAASGAMGNWTQESGFDPSIQGPASTCGSGAGAIGLAQWCEGRQPQLKSFAAEHNSQWDCLGTQLEFVWHEMTVTFGPKDLVGQMKAAKTPTEEATIWDKVYESSDGSGDRQQKAEQKYTELSGKTVSPLSNTPSSNTPSSGGNNCSTNGAASSSATSNAIPSADCASAGAKIKELHSAGKVKYDKEDLIQKDVDHCTSDPIDCGTNGGPGGANPNTLRGLAAIAMNSGVQSITLWNINSGHPCDGLDHPHGLASDIKQANGSECTGSADVCKPVFDYVIAHMKDLNIKYVIWYGPYCSQKQSSGSGSIICQADHNDHIHVSFNSAGGGSGGK